MTMKDFCDLLDYTQSTISLVENGHMYCSRKLAIRFEGVSGIDWKLMIGLDPEDFLKKVA